jgi:hypothetical protein
MRRRSLAAVAAVIAMSVSGCSSGPGDGGSPSATASSGAGAAAAAIRAVSTCMRSHGYPNFPDPVQDSEGRWGFPPSTDNMQVTGACADVVRAAKAASPNQDREKVDAATLAKLRRFSTCMRQHGVADWPDPTASGTFKLPPRLRPPAGAGKTKPNFDSQAMACRDQLPAEWGIRVEG